MANKTKGAVNSSSRSATSKKAERKTPTAIKAYLVLYNVLSTVGWAYVLGLTLTHIFNLDGNSDAINSPSTLSFFSRFFSSETPKFSSFPFIEASLPQALRPIYHRTTTAFARVGPQTAFVQSFAVLEIVHVLLGWVRSPVQTTAMQVASRLFLVWGVANQFPEVRSNPLYTSMVLAWSSTEVIRYTFYAFNLVGQNPYILLWLRYTTFYILYPVGASSEAFLIYATLPKTSGLLPQPKSTTDYIRTSLFAIWWPGLYVMYTYMIAQRRKTLGKPKAKTLKTS